MAISESQQKGLLAFTSLTFGVAPDSATLESLSSRLEESGSLASLGNQLLSSDRFASQFEEGATRADKIEVLLNRLGLEDGSDGYEAASDFLTARLEAGQSPAQSLITLVEKMSDLDSISADDLSTAGRTQLEQAYQALFNKADVSLAYAQSGVSGLSQPQLLSNVDFSEGSTLLAQQEIQFLSNKGGGAYLTTGTDNLLGGDANDIAVGTISPFATANTLNADDRIDGGSGFDVVRLNVGANFGGFSDNGGISNVERIDLINTGSTAREFNAAGIESAPRFLIDAREGGVVNLTNVESLDSYVTLRGLESGSFSVGYADGVTSGANDTARLSLLNVGTSSAVNLQGMSGVESVSLYASGINQINTEALSSVANYTVRGDGDLTVANALNASVRSFNASELRGDLNVTLGANVRANASLTGGSGDDTVTITAGGTAAYALNNIETVSLANTDALTFTARNSSGINTVDVTAASAGATITGLNSDITLNLAGVTDSGLVTLSNNGETTVNVSETDTGRNATLNNSSNVSLNVATGGAYSGTLTANAAQVVTLAALGAVTGTVSAAQATELNVTSVETASDVTFTAAKAQSLTINADENFTVNDASTLTGLQSLNATVGEDATLTTGALGAVEGVTLQGEGDVVLGNLGTADRDAALQIDANSINDLTVGTIDANGVVVNADSVQGAVALGTINAGDEGDVTLNLANTTGAVTLGDVTGASVTVNASEALGEVSVGAIEVASSLTFNGPELSSVTGSGDNGEVAITATGESFSGVLNGGLENDTFTITGDEDTSSYSITGDLDLGENTLTVDASGFTPGESNGNVSATGVAIDVSGLNGADVTITGTNASDTIMAGSGDDSITTGGSGNIVTGGMGADTFIFSDDGDADTTQFNTITDFQVGTDILSNFAGTSYDSDTAFGYLENAGVAGTGNVVEFTGFDFDGAGTGDLGSVYQFNNAFYAINDDGSSVVQLTGITAANAGLTDATPA